MNPRSILSNFWGSLHFDTPSCYRIVLNLLSSFFLIGCLKISKILYLEGLDVG